VGEDHEHRRQADRQRQASGKFDVRAEQQHQSWDQQFTRGNAEQRRDNADAKTRGASSPSNGDPSRVIEAADAAMAKGAALARFKSLPP
jgi:hypothetical protein